jgi:bifunctional aspartokinase / homoserine dehydrogenase 1
MVVVTSALGGVTDQLLRAITEAEQRSGTHRKILEEIRQRHHGVAAAVAPGEELDGLGAVLDGVLAEVDELLHGIYLLRQCTPRFSDAIVSAGERLAAPIVAAAVRAAGQQAVDIDARDLILTDDSFGEAAVDDSATHDRILEVFADLAIEQVVVVTGFIAATADGVTTTLGRSGSDYTATILGGVLDAEAVVIWTDVDGVLSADPKLVPDAYTLPQLTYQEAAELAHFGAKVLHPRTMRPIEHGRSQLSIKDTARPDAAGTRITDEVVDAGPPIKALTAVRDVALITLHGSGLLTVPDLSARTFGALSYSNLEVMLITQASSEGSLCLAVREKDSAEAAAVLRAAFERECERGDLREITVEDRLAIVAAVGHGMARRTGLAGKMFATLARAHVNVRAIAEGASMHNMACAVSDEDAGRAIEALHEAFALNRLRAHVVVIGVGTMGSRLLGLLDRQVQPLQEQRVNLRLAGVADSRRLLWDDGGLPFSEAAEKLATVDESDGDVSARVTDQLRRARLERLIVVDTTPSDDVPRAYRDWLAAGAAIVTPNQRALAGEMDLLQSIREAAVTAEVPFLYETTVGSGLSVVSTLRDLVRTGDTVHRIEGVFSGTLSFVFEALRRGRTFSEAVREAADRGLTEPDPRVDLSGEDVSRKLLILAREMGRPVERSAVHVQSLVPEPLRHISLDEFWQRLSEIDAFWRGKLAEFRGQGQHLQYVAVLSDDDLRAGVQALPVASPLVNLSGASVLFAFHTSRYSPEPLVVRGPGASVDVTAAVLLADIVRAAELMR